MGYGGSRDDAAERLGRSGDEGVDGVIREDKLGLDLIYVQAKKWSNPVGRPEINALSVLCTASERAKGCSSQRLRSAARPSAMPMGYHHA